jgi:hypothetical protein
MTTTTQPKYFEYELNGLTQRVASTTKVFAVRLQNHYKIKGEETENATLEKLYLVTGCTMQGRDICSSFTDKATAEAFAQRIADSFDVPSFDDESEDD